MRQRTIEKSVSCSGIGLYSGEKGDVYFYPALPDTGIVFSINGKNGRSFFRPSPEFVSDTRLATSLSYNGQKINTVEHLLAAIRGLEIDNIVVVLNGQEVPIMDGSSESFVFLLRQAGIIQQKAKRKVLVLKKEVNIREGGRWIKARPRKGFKVHCCIDFQHPLVGKQEYNYVAGKRYFENKIAKARTFGFLPEVEKMKANGKILGGSLDNAVVLDDKGILNREGLRFPNEPVRHKLLDFIGDLGLLPYPLWGDFEVYCAGHTMHTQFVNYLVENKKDVLELIELEERAPREKKYQYQECYQPV